MTPSRERTMGKAILGDPLLVEALEAFGYDEDTGKLSTTVRYLLLRLLKDWQWLTRTPEDGLTAGPRLQAFRHRRAPQDEHLAAVVPLVRRTPAPVATEFPSRSA